MTVAECEHFSRIEISRATIERCERNGKRDIAAASRDLIDQLLDMHLAECALLPGGWAAR